MSGFDLRQAQGLPSGYSLILGSSITSPPRNIRRQDIRIAYPDRRLSGSIEQTTFDPALASYRNGVGSITDLNVLSMQLPQAKKASTDVYSAALAGGGLAGVGDRLSPP
jgi:hypothetical protein